MNITDPYYTVDRKTHRVLWFYVNGSYVGLLSSRLRYRTFFKDNFPLKILK